MNTRISVVTLTQFVKANTFDYLEILKENTEENQTMYSEVLPHFNH